MDKNQHNVLKTTYRKAARPKDGKNARKGSLPKNGAEAQKLQRKQNKTLEQMTEKYIQWIY